MLCEKPHNGADTEQSSTDSPLSLIETSEFFPDPSSLMEANHHYRLNNRHSGHARPYD